MKYLITGANGQLGRALNKLLNDEMQKNSSPLSEGVSIVNTGRHGTGQIRELDITDKDAVSRLVEEEKPDVIINCAAHTGVDLCETEEELAFAINALGPKYLGMAAEAVGAKMVQVSTDYVFDGRKDTPYTETDVTNPQCVYGITKLAGEEQAQKVCSRLYIVRTAWLYGDGKNFVRTMLHLAKEHDHFTVVNDQFGTPTSALELSRMILFLVRTDRYGIYHGSCEGSTSWYRFAMEIFRQAGIKGLSIRPVPSSEYPQKAKRPACSVLENHRLNTETVYRMKPWKEALEEYMEGERNKL